MERQFYKYALLVILIGLLFGGCDDFLTCDPETRVTNINFWKTEEDLQAAVWALHARLRENYSDVMMVMRDRGLLFDDLSGKNADMVNNDLSKAYERDHPLFAWTYEYQVVACANLIIDNIHRADLPEERRNFYLGQALGVRAFCYFYILRTWGDAPLVRYAEDVGEKGRTPWQELADFAMADLEKAAEILPVAAELKDANGIAITSKQYISRGTAYALLAHLYAWKAALNHEPELNLKALEAANEVIEKGGYRLVDSPAEVCLEVMHGNSEEGILEFDFDESKGESKSVGSFMAGMCQAWPLDPRATPAKRNARRITNDLVFRLYPDKTDQRREEYFYCLDSMADVSVSITKGCAYIYKWRHPVVYTEGPWLNKVKTYDENDVLIRLADIILLRAELRLKADDRAGAIADLNVIRKRAGAREYKDAEGDLAAAVALERDRELFLEGLCLRYWDKVRNGTFRELSEGFRRLTDEEVAQGALYLPVAMLAFVDNPAMRQSIYWKTHGFNY